MVVAISSQELNSNACSIGENYSICEGAFEGPEKLLEIWFSPSSDRVKEHQQVAKDRGLLAVPRPIWEQMLAIVKCTVLNVIKHDQVHAYLLSESSMFVYPHKMIIKTCGTTTLLLSLPRILDIAKEACGFQKVWRVFYSRKAFMFPDRQLEPHTSWESEVAYLDRYFDDGSAYKIGNVQGDHWHLYMSQCEEDEEDVLHETGLPVMPHVNRELREENILDSGCTTPNRSDDEDDLKVSPFGIRTGLGKGIEDQTVEILMTKLNPKNMERFYQQPGSPVGIEGGKLVDKITGIGQLYPSADIDSYLFEPCGYSSNGLWQDRYFTFHVTPEPECSYASFETNIPVSASHPLNQADGDPIDQLVRQVIDIFDPGCFTVTFFTSHVPDGHRHQRMIRAMSEKKGYTRSDRILYEFDGYDLVYGHYIKK
ncbi:S-adenosylmethionine decarboxylase [Hesseltinella vesiculosa]|uniref:adenosylmethionine decarboxylase n=1 Tax=Hesseltinella vesiculosa TaxID=101127 RepID=A0A1X2GTL1_9FUNG|nr:S-adenosylmethionine decarboxylase [Hesseltinella vesiculosa]